MIGELLTIREAGKALRLSPNGVRSLIARGELCVIRYPSSGQRAGRVVIRLSEVERFLEAYTLRRGQNEHRPRHSSRHSRGNGGNGGRYSQDVTTCGKDGKERGGARIRTGG